MTIAQATDRTDLIKHVFWFEGSRSDWMVIEGFVALWVGYRAHSITLLAFGLDSVIELISAAVLVWRLTIELQHGQKFSEQAEQRASKIGATT